jgi:N-acetylglucosamine-6-phosphate deacetylase
MSKPLAVCLKNGIIYTERQVLGSGTILMEEGKISRITQHLSAFPPDAQRLELPDGTRIIPGLIDLHIHGAAGVDVMDATPEAMETLARVLPREGTTAFLATTITQVPDAIERALSNAARFISRGKTGMAECLGIHLEGPFIHPDRAGAQPKEHIQRPDPDLARRWQELTGGLIRLVTLAPEREGGLELVRCFRELGVIVSIGHSDATYEECANAIREGASHVTHLFNGMRGLHHREIGVAGAAFLRKELSVELIADGIHVSPEMVRIAYGSITSQRLILITDAMRAKCLRSGIYELGGQVVRVEDGEARLSDGTLAGSVLQMNDALNNMRRFTGCSMEELIAMASANPARVLGVEDRKGSIAEGKDADLVALDEDGRVILTICRGEIAYRREFLSSDIKK